MVFLEYILIEMSNSHEILFAWKIYYFGMFWVPTSWGLHFEKNFSGTLKNRNFLKFWVLVRLTGPWTSHKIQVDSLWMTKKPDETHFSCNQNRTKGRVTFPFVSADRYDPREVRKYHGYVMKTDKEFFGTTRSQRVIQIWVWFWVILFILEVE